MTNHITLASILVDKLHRDGEVHPSSAEWLFDVLADALAQHPMVVRTVLAEIDFSRAARRDNIDMAAFWDDISLDTEEKTK